MLQVVMHLNGYYDWEPLPADATATDADWRARRVKRSISGGLLMKVPKDANTELLVGVGEGELHELAVGELTRGDRRAMTREELLHRLVARQHLDQNAHVDNIQEVLVHDDGPDEKGLRALLAVHVACGNVQQKDVERVVAKYLQPSDAASHVAHLHAQFEVPPERVAAEQARRKIQQDAIAAAHAAHMQNVQDAARAAGEPPTQGAK